MHRTRSLESCDITMVDGIPVTSGARTTIDLAARLGEAAVMALTDDMICMRRATRRWMHERAAKLSHGRRHVDVIVRITAPDAETEFCQRARDTDKHNRYTTSGRIPLRFTYEDVVREPARMASVIRDALGLAGGDAGRCVG